MSPKPLKSVHVRANRERASSVSPLVKQIFFAVFSGILTVAAMFADVSGHCDQGFQTGFRAAGKLSIHVRPADIEIKGADVSTVRVTCTTSHSDEDLSRISIHFRASGSTGDLDIHGGSTHNSGVRFHIEVPRQSNLYVRSNAGDVKVSNVTGDKDVELYAGDLTISVGDPQDYRHVDASLLAGDIKANAFNVNKDGLFRSFSQDNPKGKYTLHAHLLAGDLTLQ